MLNANYFLKYKIQVDKKIYKHILEENEAIEDAQSEKAPSARQSGSKREDTQINKE